MKLLYKHIKLFNEWGTWQADYQYPNGTRFALHRCCCKTKGRAYELAKQDIDYLNQRR